jgi:prepilin-type N-terminal cleavage/methylation domain-containing protein
MRRRPARRHSTRRRSAASRPHRRASRRGFTLVETAISSLLVGILLAASMQTVGTVFRQRSLAADKMTARLLADQMLAEVLEMSYQEPHGAAQFGPESGEAGSRALFDDADDFHGYSESPPKYRDGTSMTQWTGWTRSVAVEEVATNDPVMTATLTAGGITVGLGVRSGGPVSTGVRKITVTVRRNGTIVATAHGLRTTSWK